MPRHELQQLGQKHPKPSLPQWAAPLLTSCCPKHSQAAQVSETHRLEAGVLLTLLCVFLVKTEKIAPENGPGIDLAYGDGSRYGPGFSDLYGCLID